MFLEMRGGTLSFTFFCGLLHSTHMRQDTGPQVLMKGETEERHSTNMPQIVCIAIGKDYMMDKEKKKKEFSQRCTSQSLVNRPRAAEKKQLTKRPAGEGLGWLCASLTPTPKSLAAKVQIPRGEFLLFQFRVAAALWDAGARRHHVFTVTALTLPS